MSDRGSEMHLFTHLLRHAGLGPWGRELMTLTIALIIVAMVLLAALELRLFWSIGDPSRRGIEDRHPDRDRDPDDDQHEQRVLEWSQPSP
jgi:hypothetical protein